MTNITEVSMLSELYQKKENSKCHSVAFKTSLGLTRTNIPRLMELFQLHVTITLTK